MRVGVLSLILVVAAGLLFAAAPAALAAVDQFCLVSEATTFSPPVTNSPQNVTVSISGNLFNCTSSSAPTGTYQETLVVPGLTCTNALLSGSGTRVFNWTNTAIAPSAFTYNRTVTRVNGTVQVEFLGEISSGTFTPDPAKEEVTGPDLNPIACLTAGVRQLAFVGILEIGL